MTYFYYKILTALDGLPCEKLVDVYNGVLKVLGASEREYIYKNDDETIDRVFKDWKPSEVVHCFNNRGWPNDDYFVYDDIRGWWTLGWTELVEEYVDSDDLAETILSRCIRCGVPEIDEIVEAEVERKIKNALEGLSYEKLIDVYNKVLKSLGVENVKGAYIYKADDETVNKVFEGWKPTQILASLRGRKWDWTNAEYFGYTDMCGWETWADAREAFESYESIDNLTAMILQCTNCEVPEIDKIITNKLVKANTIEEALRIARNENETLNEER